MSDSERAALLAAVELLHNCRATFVRDEWVRVTSGSVTIDRDVATFQLTGPHAPALLAYAWSDPGFTPDATHHRVVLHEAAVKSPQHAVAGFFLSEPTLKDVDGSGDSVHPPFE